MSDPLAFWKTSKSPNGRAWTEQIRSFPKPGRAEIFRKVWGPSESREDEEQERTSRLNRWNITSSQRDKPGDSGAKRVKAPKAAEEKAKLEKAGKQQLFWF